ncbi:putative eka-like protein [Erysiphe necator]|uniref:Putative eka-like protein n=1 Tax=Uncinula necator TaxID=52586 RepID=A0A0B1P0E1_UNCNE|nr:putative eka-like protein [Erysiphe necator]
MAGSMEIFTESQAPSTDTSKQPPPIHNPPIIIASPPPPTNNSDAANTFLPKELAEIVANRQRRERAWHPRLMLCTTVISNIDSTLENITDDIEKEEAFALKAYLQLAIANFAAVDTSPAPSQIPSYSRPTKFSSHGSGKYKTTAKEVTVAIPRTIKGAVTSEESTQQAHKLPKPPQLNERTWATVARNGQKKARVTLSMKTQAVPTSKATQRVTNKRNSITTAPTDQRLFVRIPQEHEWRKLSPAGIREIIVQKLSISPSLIGKIKPVDSGFALSPCSTEARQAILDAGNGLFLSGAKLEPATNWIPVIIPTVPSSIRKVQGQVEINHLMLTDEVERVCSMRPAYVKLYGRNKSEAPHRTWMAYFPKAPRTGFRVFDESGIARPFKKQQPLEFCKRCNGHHPTKNYSRAPSCGNCGSTNHSEGLCMATTKCRNCGGPHRSDSRRCLARPTRSGAPTKEQMKAFRQAGEREFQAVLRAKAAEESATSAKDFSVGKISSQTTEVDANANINTASPVDSSMGDALRL